MGNSLDSFGSCFPHQNLRHVYLATCIMFERYCFTRSKSSIMSSSLLFTMLMLASMSLMLAFGRCTLKMNWKQKAPQTPPRMGPTQNTLHRIRKNQILQFLGHDVPVIGELVDNKGRPQRSGGVERSLVAGQGCHIGQANLEQRALKIFHNISQCSP